jgi:hypothetical protein
VENGTVAAKRGEQSIRQAAVMMVCREYEVGRTLYSLVEGKPISQGRSMMDIERRVQPGKCELNVEPGKAIVCGRGECDNSAGS